MTKGAGAMNDVKLLEILVVDDDEVDREMVIRLLAKTHLESRVTQASDPVAALELLKEGTFDLVILDYHFPRHDGLGVLKELRDLGNRVPVIALTGVDQTSVAVNLMKNGAADYLAKGGVTAARLEEGIRHALQLGEWEATTRAVQDALLASEDLTRRILEASAERIEVAGVAAQTSAATPERRSVEPQPIADWRARNRVGLWEGAARPCVPPRSAEPVAAAAPYAIRSRLQGPTGPATSIRNLTTGGTYTVRAENPALLLYLLARQRVMDVEANVDAAEAGWLGDDELASGIWGRSAMQQATHLNVLVWRVRRELQTAGFDGWCVEKYKRRTRLHVSEAEIE